MPYKGADMLLEAAADLLRSGQLELDIIGDGPMMADLKKTAQRLGIDQSVNFHGNLPHTEVQSIAANTNLLTFPSIREFGGGVVLEAMALGVVPAVVDYAGPGELVTDEIGYKIPIGTRAEIITRLNSQLTAIVGNPSELPAKGRAAQSHALKHFTWRAKAEQIAKVYDWVLNAGERPEIIPKN